MFNLVYLCFAGVLLLENSVDCSYEDILDAQPTLVSIRFRISMHMCAGVLLDDRQTILTSAECVRRYEGISKYILHENGVTVTMAHPGFTTGNGRLNMISKVTTFSGYRGIYGRSATSDLALVRLRFANYENKLRAVTLPQQNGTSNSTQLGPCFLLKWQKTNMEDSCDRMNDTAIENAQIRSARTCGKYYPDLNGRQICATMSPIVNSTAGATDDVTKADIGSPLLCRQFDRQTNESSVVIAGILSFGQYQLPCGHKPLPTYFDLVPTYVDWIRKNM